MQMTRETATTIMRWVIVLALFGAVIYQSDQVKTVQLKLDSKTVQYESLHLNWLEVSQENAACRNK